MANAHHHKHKRKRIYKYREKYPSTKRRIRVLDLLVTWLGFGMAAATIPQVYVIFANKNAVGVSEISWGYYTLFYAVFLSYGFAHKEKPIIIVYSFCLVLYASIFIGALIY